MYRIYAYSDNASKIELTSEFLTFLALVRDSGYSLNKFCEKNEVKYIWSEESLSLEFKSEKHYLALLLKG
jgi:hypothetical protein